MIRISSRSTFFYKRVFPTIWFGFLGLFVCVGLWQGIAKKPLAEGLPFVLVPLLMAGFGYVLMRWIVFDLVDEVWDAGSELVVKIRGRETQIPFEQILNLNYQGFVNPPRITLLLRSPCELGEEISFTPPMRLFYLSMPPIAKDLIHRIDAAKTGAKS